MTTKLIVVAGFLVAFAAGLMTGLQRPEVVATNKPATNPSMNFNEPRPGPRRGPPPSVFAWQLNLNSEQQEKFRSIWLEMNELSGRDMEDKRQKAKQKRDDRILELANAEAQPEVQKALNEYTEFMEKMNQDYRTTYDQAVAQTNALLTAEQRPKWDEILARLESGRGGRGPDRGPGGRGGRGGGRGGRGGDPRFEERGGRATTTRPATMDIK